MGVADTEQQLRLQQPAARHLPGQNALLGDNLGYQTEPLHTRHVISRKYLGTACLDIHLSDFCLRFGVSKEAKTTFSTNPGS